MIDHASGCRLAPTAFTRVRIVAPRSAASRALSATSLASSIQQSEYSKPWRAPGLRGSPAGSRREIEDARGRQEFAPAEMVVEKEPEPHHPAGPGRVGVRHDEPQRPDDVRRHPPHDLPLGERFADEPELVVLEIAQPAVQQLRRGRGRRAREVALFAEIDRQAAPGCVARDAAAVDASADDRDVVGVSHRRAPSGPRQHSRPVLQESRIRSLRAAGAGARRAASYAAVARSAGATFAISAKKEPTRSIMRSLSLSRVAT